MPPVERGCAPRETILGNAGSFQVLRLLMALSARKWMIHLCAIIATSFWSHDRQTDSVTDLSQAFPGWRKLIYKQDTDQALASLEN